MYKCYIQLGAICSSPTIWWARATGWIWKREQEHTARPRNCFVWSLKFMQKLHNNKRSWLNLQGVSLAHASKWVTCPPSFILHILQKSDPSRTKTCWKAKTFFFRFNSVSRHQMINGCQWVKNWGRRLPVTWVVARRKHKVGVCRRLRNGKTKMHVVPSQRMKE